MNPVSRGRRNRLKLLAGLRIASRNHSNFRRHGCFEQCLERLFNGPGSMSTRQQEDNGSVAVQTTDWWGLSSPGGGNAPSYWVTQ